MLTVNVPHHAHAQYALHNNLLSEVSLPSDRPIDDMFVFSKRVTPRGKITNQHASGRCWLFAALNLLRLPFIEKLNLPTSFEFSQSYLFFWDKLERVNYVLQIVEHESTRGGGGAGTGAAPVSDDEVRPVAPEALDGRMLQFLLKDPLGDGGQWQMFRNLVEKYGLVPKSVYPDGAHSRNSRGLNMVLTKKVREWCSHARAGRLNRQAALRETYTLLTRFLGKPPREFSWEYYDRSDTHQRLPRLTPQKFYQEQVGAPLAQYVSLIHDPRHGYNATYGVRHLGNVAGADDVKYLNLPIERLIELTQASIQANEAVWFGSDVGQALRSQSCVMDARLFDIEGFLGVRFGLNKRERLEYGESQMTHAMLITGYNEDAHGHIDRWEVENSWGTKGPGSGYYVMTTDWFRENVFQVVVRRDRLTPAEQSQWDQAVSREHTFPPWDPMGALAHVINARAERS